jgi:hypothetical protein
MASVTLAQLKTRAKQRADMENSSFIADSELTAYINASYQELYDVLISTSRDNYITSASATITTGQTVSLPADFYLLVGLDKYNSAGEYYTINKFNFSDRNQILLDEIRYRVNGGGIRIEPEQNAAGVYKIWYIPLCTPLSLSTDAVVGVNGFEEYIVVDTAIKMLTKEESSTAALSKAKDELLKRIKSMNITRDVEPDTISDVSLREINGLRYFL